MTTAGRPTAVETADSGSWDGPGPSVSVVVATYGRSGFLDELLDRLEGQDLDAHDFEIVVVDNGSTDDTWERLADRVRGSGSRARAVRLSHNQGPAAGRNHGVAQARAAVLAITDDDCLPTPGWVRGMRDEVVAGFDVVQGTVFPDPAGADDMGPWDHTKRIARPTPFFETCNIAYRRAAFDSVGGFDEDDPLLHPPNGRAFGEDACLAWAIQQAGGSAGWAPEAVVYHRVIPSGFSRWLDDQRQLVGMPGLVKRSPLIAARLHRGIFLDRRSELFVWAVAGAGAAVVTRRWVFALAALPWIRRRLPEARRHGDTAGEVAEVLGRYAVSDGVALGAMVRGSIRHRRILL